MNHKHELVKPHGDQLITIIGGLVCCVAIYLYFVRIMINSGSIIALMLCGLLLVAPVYIGMNAVAHWFGGNLDPIWILLPVVLSALVPEP